MTCRQISDGHGGIIIACSRGAPRCQECGAGKGTQLCDWKLRGELAGRTCDRRLCVRCARSPQPGKDLCPTHMRMWEQRLAAAERGEP